MKPQCVALLMAGGQGRRMDTPVPKQYIEVAGRPVLAYTLRAFARHEGVDAVCVVCEDSWASHVAVLAGAEAGAKFRGTFPAGERLFDSLRSGVDGLQRAGWPAETLVLVHDGVRPLVPQSVITSSLETLRAEGSAVAALPSNEAFMLSRDGARATAFSPREHRYLAQTPHAFALGTLAEAFAEADRRGIRASQSLYTLMAELERWPLALSQGAWLNFKLTRPEDLELFARLAAAGLCG